jgi:hypothetical protein
LRSDDGYPHHIPRCPTCCYWPRTILSDYISFTHLTEVTLKCNQISNIKWVHDLWAREMEEQIWAKSGPLGWTSTWLQVQNPTKWPRGE